MSRRPRQGRGLFVVGERRAGGDATVPAVPPPAEAVATSERYTSFQVGETYLIKTTRERYAFTIEDASAASGTIVGGRFEDPWSATLVASFPLDTSELLVRALQVGFLAVFVVTRPGRTRMLYRLAEVQSVRRWSNSDVAPVADESIADDL